MPTIQYEVWNSSDRLFQLAQECVSIARSYQQQGYDLSVRQLYYQLVARDRIENTDKSYKQIVNVVDKARMSGLMDWDMIVDRTRRLSGNQHWDSPDQIVDAAARGFRIDKWEGQPRRVEVWVEKEALSGVVGRAAEQEDVDWFACRGYSSSSAMWRAAQRFYWYWRSGQAVTVLHLGDHDPSGIDMSRDIEDRLQLFLSVDWATRYSEAFASEPLYVQYKEVVEHLSSYVTGEPLQIKRIALNMDQVLAYNPPPNFAKVTDSRAGKYISQYGDQSWELDALDPTTLADLIRNEIHFLRDDERYNARLDAETGERARLERLTGRWDEVSAFLDTLED